MLEPQDKPTEDLNDEAGRAEELEREFRRAAEAEPFSDELVRQIHDHVARRISDPTTNSNVYRNLVAVTRKLIARAMPAIALSAATIAAVAAFQWSSLDGRLKAQQEEMGAQQVQIGAGQEENGRLIAQVGRLTSERDALKRQSHDLQGMVATTQDELQSVRKRWAEEDRNIEKLLKAFAELRKKSENAEQERRTAIGATASGELNSIHSSAGESARTQDRCRETCRPTMIRAAGGRTE